MTVAELIELLKTFPQDLPVTGYNGCEETDFVTAKGVRVRKSGKGEWDSIWKGGDIYEGEYLDIMGL